MGGEKRMNILALDIGGTAIKVAMVTSEGNILKSAEYPSGGKRGGPYVIDKVCEIISSYNGYDKIGISTTGQVDPKAGTIIFANENIPDYTGMPVRDIISEKFKVPVAVENDVNAAALGEAHYGVGKQYKDFLCITYGTGIGGSIVIDQKVYRGSEGIAGEFGHIITHPDGLNCGCGQKGCYEQYASTTALVRMCRQEDLSLINGKVIFHELNNGNRRIKNIVDQWIDEVVLGLVSLIHIFNPRCLILGGGILDQEYIIKGIRNKLYGRIMISYTQVEVKKATLGNNAGVLGAVHLVLNK